MQNADILSSLKEDVYKEKKGIRSLTCNVSFNNRYDDTPSLKDYCEIKIICRRAYKSLYCILLLSYLREHFAIISFTLCVSEQLDGDRKEEILNIGIPDKYIFKRFNLNKIRIIIAILLTNIYKMTTELQFSFALYLIIKNTQMKKLMMLHVFLAAIGFSACGQKITADKVPTAVKVSFAKKYPGAVAKWEKEGGKYEAGFKENGNKMSALFEAGGAMTESEMDIKVNTLPAAVLAYVKKNYPGKTIKEGAKITKADGTINYEAEVSGTDVIFDTKGKFLKEVKE